MPKHASCTFNAAHHSMANIRMSAGDCTTARILRHHSATLCSLKMSRNPQTFRCKADAGRFQMCEAASVWYLDLFRSVCMEMQRTRGRSEHCKAQRIAALSSRRNGGKSSNGTSRSERKKPSAAAQAVVHVPLLPPLGSPSIH